MQIPVFRKVCVCIKWFHSCHSKWKYLTGKAKAGIWRLPIIFKFPWLLQFVPLSTAHLGWDNPPLFFFCLHVMEKRLQGLFRLKRGFAWPLRIYPSLGGVFPSLSACPSESDHGAYMEHPHPYSAGVTMETAGWDSQGAPSPSPAPPALGAGAGAGRLPLGKPPRALEGFPARPALWPLGTGEKRAGSAACLVSGGRGWVTQRAAELALSFPACFRILQAVWLGNSELKEVVGW